MRYVNDETAKKLVELQIKNREYAFSLYDEIIEVLAKFDGKQVTKRIETALRKIDDNIRVENEYNSFIIKVGFWGTEKRSIKTENGIASASLEIGKTYTCIPYYGMNIYTDDKKIVCISVFFLKLKRYQMFQYDEKLFISLKEYRKQKLKKK